MSMLSWVVVPDDSEQHPRPAWPGLPLSCISQLQPRTAQPTAPSWLQELSPSVPSGQLQFQVPSRSCLLGILASSTQCG